MSTATIVGLGTIGSVVASLVARMPDIAQLTLIDPDAYTESNLVNQAIDATAPGKPKVEVQAALVHAINPKIQVDAIESTVENVPLARMDSTVLVSCVDNRNARQTINRVAWRHGNPWIDAAVDTGSLVRIITYVPGGLAPCIECGWDQQSYDLLEQEYPCDAGNSPVSATGTPVELGTLAASMQAGELRRLLGDAVNGGSLVGSQLMIDTLTHTRHISRFKRNAQCRFDHKLWSVERVQLTPQENTLADLFNAIPAGSDSAITLEGHTFAMYVDCVACGRRSNVGLALYGRLPIDARTCGCGGRMIAPGFFRFEALQRSELSPALLRMKLSALGLQSGDVLSVDDGSGPTRHIEIRYGADQ